MILTQNEIPEYLQASPVSRFLMRPRRKPVQGRSGAQIKSGALLEQVLAASAQFPVDAKALREHMTEASRRIFQAGVAGVLIQDQQGYGLSAVSPSGKEDTADASLLSHARSFAAQAVESKRLVNFRFSYRDSGGDEKIYCGLAQPLLTAKSASALLVVRRAVFSPAEVSVFHVFGTLARMALENAELWVSTPASRTA